jgi:hypothetical protein
MVTKGFEVKVVGRSHGMGLLKILHKFRGAEMGEKK